MKKKYCIIENSSNCVIHNDCWREITRKLEQSGWHKTNNVKKSDIILIKQCCMTTEEINETIKVLAGLSKKNVQGKVFLGECASRTRELVETTKTKLSKLSIDTFTTVEEFFQKLHESYKQEENLNLSILPDNSVVINISFGCNRRCTFCKMEYMDYPFYSVPMEEILKRVKIAKEQGIRKIVLNALNSTQYNDNGRRLQDLLKALLEIPDMYYQLNGVVIAELTNETIEILQDRRFLCVQMELQSFIPTVREKMKIGQVPAERILSICKKLKGKWIVSNIMTGFCGETDASFRKQLEIIRKNNLFFITVNNLVPTPGTEASKMNNPTVSQAQERMLDLTLVLAKLRKATADEMLGKVQQCVVISEYFKGHSMLLAKNGVLIGTDRRNLRVGETVTVIPKSVVGLFVGDQQALILTTEDMRHKQKFDELTMISTMVKTRKQQLVEKKMKEDFNRMPISLKEYCEKRFDEELK